jgi:CRISPR-associated protein Cmr2
VNEVENPILDMGKVMDSFELAKPIVCGRENNPLLSLLIGEQNYGNEAVKKLEIVKGFRNWQLLKSASSLKSIPDIAAAGVTDKLKKHSYFAIVRADGDHMGDVIKKLSGENVRDFSKNCLIYCGEIAKLVGKYGGVTIYSGGDDLLALMPCENAEQMTIFEFIQEANGLFTKSFPKETYQADVSLSWGVTICYHKFPLYEAMEDSYHMLTKIAKKRRNCVAVHLQKHAGQSESLLISNDAFQRMSDPLHQVLEEKDDVLLSAMHKLTLFKKAFAEAKDEATIKNLFVNTFDAEDHKNNSFVHEALPNALYALKTQGETSGIYAITDEGIQKDDPVLTLHYMLRMMKFFVEKEGSGQ